MRINRYFLNMFGFRLNTGKATRATHSEKNGYTYCAQETETQQVAIKKSTC